MLTRTESRRVAIALIALAATACGGRPGAQALQTVRDSAGVTIVEDRDTNWATATPWRVDTTPMVSIGVVEGPAEYRFSGIAGVLRLADGRIAVADNDSHQIRFYDTSGKFLIAVGRQGEGPGEFRIMNFLRRFRGDSLIVGDFPLRRLTIFSQNGALGRVVPGPAYQEWYFWSDANPFADGALLGRLDKGFDLMAAPRGSVRGATTYFRFNPATGAVDTLAELFGGEVYVGMRDGRKTASTPNFAARPVTASSGSRWDYGSSRTYEIRTYTEQGKLVRILRLDRPNRPVTDSLINAELQRELALVHSANGRRRVQSQHRDVPYPKALPAYGGFLVDADTDLWVARYPALGQELSDWTVFDPQGRLLGEVTTPPKFQVYDIGSDYVLGVKQDRLDVEHVAMYRLEKEQRQ